MSIESPFKKILKFSLDFELDGANSVYFRNVYTCINQLYNRIELYELNVCDCLRRPTKLLTPTLIDLRI